MDHPLFKHLEMTSRKALGRIAADINQSYSGATQKDGSTSKTVVKNQRMSVRLEDLEKAK